MEAAYCIRAFSEQQNSEVVELKIQSNHVHFWVMMPPKVSISDFGRAMKERTVIGILNRYKELKKKPYWGNHFCVKGYYVDTVGLDVEMIPNMSSIKES